jgi:DNA polymerase/3'-5' exonuclease PolX
MTNQEIAAILFNIATLLKQQDANPYRIRAYRRAARNVLRAQHSLTERARAGQPLGIPGLGPRLTKTVMQLALEGRCDVYDEVTGELPSAQQGLLRIPGIGPTLAQRIAQDLGAEAADDILQCAASAGLQRTWGIGPKRAQAIMEHLASVVQPAAPQVIRDGNIIYVQESLWNEGHKRAA